MLRRRVVAVGMVAVSSHLSAALRRLTVDAPTRDKLTQHLTAIKEECKGQSLDLADMSDASKAATRAFQECAQQSKVEDAQFKGKMTTLSASVKAYNTRLANLQNEARSIQTEVDAILKLLWGTENPQGARFSTPPPSSGSTATPPSDDATADGFDVEPPIVSKVLDGEAKQTPSSAPKVETVEGERVTDSKSSAAGGDGKNESAEEIEVETIEIEVEPAEDESAASSTAAAEKDDPVDTMRITDITKELYERGVNFADCLDARSLRQRYRDVLAGKVGGDIGGGQQRQASRAYTEPLNPNGPTGSSGSDAATNSNQPRMPPRPQHQQQYQQPPPNTNESGLAQDPYPNAQRKMVDPMKFVWEIKQEISSEKGIDPSSVDLWSGKTKLDDGKRLYDYPSIQNYPIEVRQKGDIPR